MRYQLAVMLHTIARHIDSDAGVSVTQWTHEGLRTVQVDLDDGHRMRGTWPDERDCTGQSLM